MHIIDDIVYGGESEEPMEVSAVKFLPDMIMLITLLRKYEESLCDISTDIAVKYVEALSVIDVSYQEFNAWKELSPFYRNV